MSIRKITVTALIALAALGSGLLLPGTPATAAVGHKLMRQLPVGGRSIAVDPSGNVYVTIAGEGGVIVKFDAAGKEVPGVGGPGTPFIAGTPSGPFGELYGGVGIGPKGEVYVPDRKRGAVYKFSSAGEFVPGPGGPESAFVAGFGNLIGNPVVDPEGNVYVPDQSADAVYKFTSAGVLVPGPGGPGSPFIAVPGPRGLTIDSSGNIYVCSEPQPLFNLDKFNAAGEFISGSAGPESPFISLGETPFQVAVDPTGNIYVALDGAVDEFDVTGSPLPAGSLGPFISATGVAVDSTGDVYVADRNGSVNIYGLLFLPDVTTGSVSNPTSESVTLNGTINPAGGLDAHYFFQYGVDTKYAVGSTTSVDAGSVTLGSPLGVSAVVGTVGLQPHKTYHYRIVGSTESNGDNFGGDGTFLTRSVSPSIAGQPSLSLVTQSSVTVNAGINPNNEPTGYHVEYGTTTAYGSSSPLPDASVGEGFGDVVVRPQLTSLQAGTTYHYRLVAKNPTGSVASQDATFTTAAATAPVLGGATASVTGVDTATLAGTIDPGGIQTSYEFDVGSDTSYETRVFGEAGSDKGAETVTTTVQGLMPATTYHYRLLASNIYGTTYGPDETFTTPASPAGSLTAPPTPRLVSLPVIAFPASNHPKSRKPAKKKRRAAKKTKKAKKGRGAAHRHGAHGRSK